MLEAIRNGGGAVVAYHIDRLYRRPKELEELSTWRIRPRECRHRQQRRPAARHSDGRFLARILVGVAAKESDDKSRRIRRQKRQLREAGRPSGGGRAFGWSDKMTPNPTEARRLAEAVEALIAGESLIGIAREWNAFGIAQPQTGKANWTPAGIRQMVLNPRHAALVGYRPHKHDEGGRRQDAHEIEIIGPAQWPAIVSRDRWELLRAKLTNRENRIPRRRSLLTGLLECGRCGATMVRASMPAKTGTRPVWRCPLVLPKRGCGNNTIDAAGVEAIVTEAAFQAFGSGSLDLDEGGQNPDTVELAQQIADLEERRAGLAESFATSRVSLAAFERADGRIEGDLTKLRQAFSNLGRRAAITRLAARDERLEDVWDELSLDGKRAILDATIRRVVISPVLKRGMPAFDPDRIQRIEWRA